jgi:hypothetical protein
MADSSDVRMQRRKTKLIGNSEKIEQQRLMMRRKSRAKGGLKPWESISVRNRITYVLDQSSQLADNTDIPLAILRLRKVVAYFVNVLAIALAIGVICQTLPSFQNPKEPNSGLFFYVICFCVVVFSADWALRFGCSTEKKVFMRNILNIFDLISLLPFWADVAGAIPNGIAQWVLILRVTRIIRQLLLLEEFEVIQKTIVSSTEALVFFIIIALVALPLIGCAIFMAERGSQNSVTGKWIRNCTLYQACAMEESPFQSGVDGMWFAMNLITTLGYGDLYPTSSGGKAIAAFGMMLGVFCLAYPAMIMSVNFTTEIENAEKAAMRRRARAQMALRSTQKHLTKVVDQEQLKVRGRNSIVAGANMAVQMPFRLPPLFFRCKVDGLYRRAMLLNPTDARHEPLFLLKRDADGQIVLEQHKSKKPEFRFFVILSTPESTVDCTNAITAVLPEEAQAIQRCRHQHVTSVHFALEVPPDNGLILPNLRIMRPVDDNVEPSRQMVHGTIEVQDYHRKMEDEDVTELKSNLQRCRLLMTAVVAQGEPTVYDVPFFQDVLQATSLCAALLGHKKGLVYCTEKEISALLTEVPNLISLPACDEDEEVVMINKQEIIGVVTKAVIRNCAIEDEPNFDDPTNFLYDMPIETLEGKPVKYYGVVGYKVTGVKERGMYLENIMTALAELFTVQQKPKADEVQSKVLCSLLVKVVQCKQVHRTLVM